MRGKGVLRDYSRPRTYSGKKTVKSCKVKGNLDNVVIIDIDSDGLDNVIILDVPESLQRKLGGSGVLRAGKRFPFPGGVISIDDDESDNMNCPEINVGGGGGGDLYSDGTSSSGSPTSVQGKRPAFKLSKLKKTSGKKTPSRNHYGLDLESECDASENSSSDCEVMEGSSGEFREQWEKASLKRKSNVRRGQSGLEDHTSSSSTCSDTHPNVEADNRTKQNSEAPAYSSSENFENVNSSSFADGGNGFAGGASFENMESFPWWWKPGSQENMKSYCKDDVHFRGDTYMEDCDFSYYGCQSVNGCGATLRNEGKGFQGTSSCSNEEGDGEQFLHRGTCSQDSEQNCMAEHSFQNSQSRPNLHSDYEKVNVQGEDASLCKDQHLGETHNVNDGNVLKDKNREFTHIPFSCHTYSNEGQYKSTSSMENEQLFTGETYVSNAQSSDDKVVKNVVDPSKDKFRAVSEGPFAPKTPFGGAPGVSHGKAGHQDVEKINSGERSFRRNQYPEMPSKPVTSSSTGGNEPFADSTSNIQPNDERNPLYAPLGDVMPAVQRDIIGEREKLKETDEYKRAVEEEWAARHRQLQIQAEEAQRLRKRRKAESLRILDMEKRQKQRVEEMRETQKKDEENLIMKERIRGEVRNELQKLEIMCIDMASLLHGLGIHVGGGFQPSLDEVHAAYKRALLKFHPDRASRTDIRQQVEAEEKFKLIARMKEKFLSASCF